MVSAQQEEITTWCSQGIYGTGVHTVRYLCTLPSCEFQTIIYSIILDIFYFGDGSLSPRCRNMRRQRSMLSCVRTNFKDRKASVHQCAHPGAPPLGTRGSGRSVARLFRSSSRSVNDARLLHHAMREGIYEGHCIPKGAIVIANIFFYLVR
jgi:hypothetical protein